MSWFNLLKDKKYHVTTSGAVPKIMEDGIQPRGSPKSILRGNAWTFTNLDDAREYQKESKRDLDVILEIEPDADIHFERGPDELIGTGGKSGVRGKLLETSVANIPITGKMKVVG
tara:strand:- start:323 stop:667 length:345 start_codon:yes stop_codon:yes gene_type:complete